MDMNKSMRQLKINHLYSAAFEQTIHNLEMERCLFYIWPDTMCIVAEYDSNDWDIFSHLQAGYYDEQHTINCEVQMLTQDDREQLDLKRYAM